MPLLVSIIINNFNYEHYLASAIDSALAQTYPKCEVIVVDDGSTDGSAEIISRYGTQVTAILKPNGGQSSAFNAGFQASSGDLISFLDSDDTLHPEAIKTAVKNWLPDAAKIQFPLQVVDASGVEVGLLMPRAKLTRGEILKSYLATGRYVSSPTSGNLFNRIFLEQVMPIPEDLWRETADGYLNTAAPFFGNILAVDGPLGCYRVHGNSMSSVVSNGQINLRQMEKLLRHAALERNLFFKLAELKGFAASSRAVSGHWMHLKLRLSYDKLNPAPLLKRRRTLLGHLAEIFRSVVGSSELSLSHKLQHLAWAAAVIILPRTVAMKVIIYGFDTAPKSKLSLRLRRV